MQLDYRCYVHFRDTAAFDRALDLLTVKTTALSSGMCSTRCIGERDMRARRSGGLLKQRFASLALIVCSFGSWTGMSGLKMSRLHAASEKKDLSVTCCLSMVHTEQSIFIRLFRMNTSHCENEYGTNTPLRASEPAAAYFSDP